MIFSGIAVAIGLLALVVLPVPFLRSIGYGGLLIPLISVLVAITLLPVILATIGPRLDRIGFRRRTSSAGQGWVPWGRFVVKHRWIVGGVALAHHGRALFVPVLNFSTGSPRADALAGSGSAREALDSLESSGIGPGVLSPYEVVVVDGSPDATAATAAAVEGVRGAIAPTGEAWRRGDTAIVQVFPDEEDDAPNVRAVREAVHAGDGEVLVGGGTPGVVDFNEAVYGNFIWVVLVILVVTYILLARVFRSLLLPLKAIVFNIISIGAVWGFMVFFWQEGNGSGALFDIEPTGALTVWIPLMVFAFLYGLSMDYEVFILSRMREEYDRDGSTDRAVVAGLGPHRAPGHGGLADPVPGLRRAGIRAGDRHQGVRDRARRRHPGGRDDRAQHAAAGVRVGAGPLELVDAGVGRAHPAVEPSLPPPRSGARCAQPRPGAVHPLTAPPTSPLTPGGGDASRRGGGGGRDGQREPAAISAAGAQPQRGGEPGLGGTTCPRSSAGDERHGRLAADHAADGPHDGVHAGGDAGLGGAHGVGDELGHGAEGDGDAAGPIA